MSDYSKFQWSLMSGDRAEQVVIRSDDPVEWAENIKLAKKQMETMKPVEKKMEEFIEEHKVDTSKVPVCPIHHKPMRMGKFPGSFFCATKLENGDWCKERGKSTKWE